jgi:hypothetical protein
MLYREQKYIQDWIYDVMDRERNGGLSTRKKTDVVNRNTYWGSFFNCIDSEGLYLYETSFRYILSRGPLNLVQWRSPILRWNNAQNYDGSTAQDWIDDVVKHNRNGGLSIRKGINVTNGITHWGSFLNRIDSLGLYLYETSFCYILSREPLNLVQLTARR